MRQELGTSDGARATAVGTLTAAAARRAGWGALPAVMLGGAAGAVLREVSQRTREIAREARNSGDAAALSAWLGANVPPLGAWAIEADFARLIVADTGRRPRVAVECGSGTTTLLLAMAARRNGAGRVYSLEHDERYASDTIAMLERAGLVDQVEMIVAPLARQTFGATEVDWYDLTVVGDRIPAEVDLLVVDGPPALEPWARWPALEVFADRLVPGATVLMDDGRRLHERRVAYRWASEHPELDLFWLDTVKGTWRLTRNAATTGSASRPQTAYRTVRRRVNPYPVGLGRWPVQR